MNIIQLKRISDSLQAQEDRLRAEEEEETRRFVARITALRNQREALTSGRMARHIDLVIPEGRGR